MARFQLRQFSIDDRDCGQKICSDSVLFGAWFFLPYSRVTRILDIGTGSGLLALMAAQMCAQATIDAVEIDPATAEAACCNCNEAVAWSARLKVHCADINTFSPPGKYDTMICNPPFFHNGEQSGDRRRATARHQSSLRTGTVLHFAARHLAAGGHIGVLLPADDADECIFQAELQHLKLHRQAIVYPRSGKPALRVMLDFGNSDAQEIENQIITMRSADGSLTTEYCRMVEPFYTRLT